MAKETKEEENNKRMQLEDEGFSPRVGILKSVNRRGCHDDEGSREERGCVVVTAAGQLVIYRFFFLSPTAERDTTSPMTRAVQRNLLFVSTKRNVN